MILFLAMYFELKPSSIEMSLSFLHFSSPLPGIFSFLGWGWGWGADIYAAFFCCCFLFFPQRAYFWKSRSPSRLGVLGTGVGTHFCGPAVTACSAAAFLKHHIYLIIYLCIYLFNFIKQGRRLRLLFRKGYSNFHFRCSFCNSHNHQKKRKIERGRSRNRVEGTCSILQLWTEELPWHQSIKG